MYNILYIIYIYNIHDVCVCTNYAYMHIKIRSHKVSVNGHIDTSGKSEATSRITRNHTPKEVLTCICIQSCILFVLFISYAYIYISYSYRLIVRRQNQIQIRRRKRKNRKRGIVYISYMYECIYM